MAESRHITRRLALVGAFASSVALALPAAAAVHMAEEPHSKVRRLQRELADALAELAAAPGGYDYVSVVQATGTAQYTRALTDRDLYEDGLRRRTIRERAVGVWRNAEIDQQLAWDAYLAGTVHRSTWENLNLARHDAMDAMHEVLRNV